MGQNVLEVWNFNEKYYFLVDFNLPSPQRTHLQHHWKIVLFFPLIWTWYYRKKLKKPFFFYYVDTWFWMETAIMKLKLYRFQLFRYLQRDLLLEVNFSFNINELLRKKKWSCSYWTRLNASAFSMLLCWLQLLSEQSTVCETLSHVSAGIWGNTQRLSSPTALMWENLSINLSVVVICSLGYIQMFADFRAHRRELLIFGSFHFRIQLGFYLDWYKHC